jgi:tetratricopeptide (TPR) repeat protein
VLGSSHDLTGEIKNALASSGSMAVVCSRAAAASSWVSREVSAFIELHGSERIFCLVVDGEPNAADPALECLPGPLRRAESGREVLAADARPDADGPKQAFLKIIAGISGLPYERLAQRERRRFARRALAWAAASTAVAAGFAFLAQQANESRVVAEREAKRANLTVDYLTSVLGQFLPRAGNDIPTGALLPLIDSSAEPGRLVPLAGEPAALIRVRNILATAYLDLGSQDKALDLYAENLRLAESTFGANSDAALECRFNVARACHLAGDPGRALELLEGLLEIVDRPGSPHQRQLAPVCIEMNWLLSNQRRHAEALELLEKYRERALSVLPAGHNDALIYRSNLALQMIQLGRAGEAGPLLDEAIAAKTAKGEGGDADTALFRCYRGIVFALNGGLAPAEDCFRGALVVFERKFGRENIRTISAAHKLALVLEAAGKTSESDALMKAYFGDPPDPEKLKMAMGPPKPGA